MKRLRHPIRAIREPFGTAGLIVAMIALVAALGGTALAAAKLNGTQKKEVEKIAKKYAGKPGAVGATGPAGAAGKEGPAGLAGKEGKQGIQGLSGTTGFTKTLPKGETETGSWASTPFAPTETAGYTAVSFNIPLKGALPQGHAVFAGNSGNGTTCAGSAVEPKAQEGYLCVYAGASYVEEIVVFRPSSEGFDSPGSLGATDATGAVLLVENHEEAGAPSWGTWAMTAAE